MRTRCHQRLTNVDFIYLRGKLFYEYLLDVFPKMHRAYSRG